MLKCTNHKINRCPGFWAQLSSLLVKQRRINIRREQPKKEQESGCQSLTFTTKGLYFLFHFLEKKALQQAAPSQRGELWNAITHHLHSVHRSARSQKVWSSVSQPNLDLPLTAPCCCLGSWCCHREQSSALCSTPYELLCSGTNRAMEPQLLLMHLVL